MTPMPTNPVIVLYVAADGTVVRERNNIGNDLKIVVVYDNLAEFQKEAAGVPYTGLTVHGW